MTSYSSRGLPLQPDPSQGFILTCQCEEVSKSPQGEWPGGQSDLFPRVCSVTPCIGRDLSRILGWGYSNCFGMFWNFKKGFSGDYGVILTPGKLLPFCELGWPTFGIGCPLEGTLDVPTVQAVYKVVSGDPGHYIDQWLEVAQVKPPWVQFCIKSKGQYRVLVA